jgi:hypothetical protein
MFDEATMTPCIGICDGCKEIFANVPQGDWGLFTLYASANNIPIHFFLINCAKIYTPKELNDKLAEISQCSGSGYTIVFMDEVHRLVQRNMDVILLKDVEEAKYFWFFATAKPKDLEDMFDNRAILIATELPTVREMEHLLVGLCDENKINGSQRQLLVLSTSAIGLSATHFGLCLWPRSTQMALRWTLLKMTSTSNWINNETMGQGCPVHFHHISH